MLGSPIDTFKQVLAVAQLGNWEPGAAIWYSRACCSAGSDHCLALRGINPPNPARPARCCGRSRLCAQRASRRSHARCSGAFNPLAAFLGHVEPTFDWTLRNPITKEEMTRTIIRCLYDRLFTTEHRAPVGWALSETFAEVGQPVRVESERQTRRTIAVTLDVYRKLAAIDRQNLVILGDPTVTIHHGRA